MTKTRTLTHGLWLVALGLTAAVAQQRAASFTPPEEIDYRKAGIISEGTRMSAELFSLKSAAGKALPTILMAHGWGGTAAGLRTVALDFARAGYFVVTFDYRGWGGSDSRVILTGPAPAEKSGNRFVAEVQEVREVVDPMDMTTDWLNAIHWLQGERACDKERIGLWGSSYSGGHVVWAAARDPRVKAIVSQVPSLDSRFVVATEADRKLTYEEATKRARGELGYPAPRARVIGNLQGGPVREKLLLYAPVEDVEKAGQAAMLFITAEKEELFNNDDHAGRAYARAKGPKKLIVIPGITHYGIYTTARVEATRMGIEWFDQHLKN
jgi:hypothetical protein